MCIPHKGVQLCLAIFVTITSTMLLLIGKSHNWYEMDMRLAIAILVICLNLLTAFLFWLDKVCAMDELEHLEGKVFDVVLIYMTFFGSPIGALLGMYCCCCPHKLMHNRFMCQLIPFLVINMIWVFAWFMATGKTLHYLHEQIS